MMTTSHAFLASTSRINGSSAPLTSLIQATPNCNARSATSAWRVSILILGGTIIDADIEMNEVNFTFIQSPTAKTVRKGTAEADFENTLTHEMGHLMGLDHTCADSSTPANALDNNGVRPVSCDQLKTLAAAARSVIEEATMFNRATPGETKKRTPEADDIAGICEAYPSSGKVPTRCAPVDLASYNSGCQIAPSSSAPAWPSLLLLGVVGFVLARRLRRRAA